MIPFYTSYGLKVTTLQPQQPSYKIIYNIKISNQIFFFFTNAKTHRVANSQELLIGLISGKHNFFSHSSHLGLLHVAILRHGLCLRWLSGHWSRRHHRPISLPELGWAGNESFYRQVKKEWGWWRGLGDEQRRWQERSCGHFLDNEPHGCWRLAGLLTEQQMLSCFVVWIRSFVCNSGGFFLPEFHWVWIRPILGNTFPIQYNWNLFYSP